MRSLESKSKLVPNQACSTSSQTPRSKPNLVRAFRYSNYYQKRLTFVMKSQASAGMVFSSGKLSAFTVTLPTCLSSYSLLELSKGLFLKKS